MIILILRLTLIYGWTTYVVSRRNHRKHLFLNCCEGTFTAPLPNNRSIRCGGIYVKDGQSASLSWCQAPSLWPDLCYCQTVVGLLIWGALSDKRTGLPFTIAGGPRKRSHSWVRVPLFYCRLRIETPPTWWARSLYLYPPGTCWPSYNPRQWVPFSSPLTTRRATVEVFEPASTRTGKYV
jgi:hypothetical protein